MYMKTRMDTNQENTASLIKQVTYDEIAEAIVKGQLTEVPKLAQKLHIDTPPEVHLENPVSFIGMVLHL